MTLLFVVGVVTALLLGLSFLFAELLIHPPRNRPTDFTPSDAGLPFEWVTFASHDGLRLMGWLFMERGFSVYSRPPGSTRNKVRLQCAGPPL